MSDGAPNSRSIQRRVALQKGEKMPTFDGAPCPHLRLDAVRRCLDCNYIITEVRVSDGAPMTRAQQEAEDWWCDHVSEFTDLDAPTEKVWRIGDALAAFAAEAVQQERERCAKVAEDTERCKGHGFSSGGYYSCCGTSIAAAIRKGEQP